MRDAKEYMDVAVIHSSFEKNPLTVAFVKVDKELDDIQKCEVAYKLTNTIDVPWWKGDMVIPTFPILHASHFSAWNMENLEWASMSD